jgi:hypothetical protein
MNDSLAYLRTPAAIRERAEKMLTYVEDGKSSWFAFDGDGLEAAVQATLEVTRKRFPNPSDIPFHSRWRQFEAGGRDRWAALAERLKGLPKEEIARRRMDLAVVSVLLDAGAGPAWSYREPGTGETYARSEGLGVEIVEQVAIPDELIPADAQVEMDAKKAAGYFTAKRTEGVDLVKPKGRGLME